MSTYETIKALCKRNGIAVTFLEQQLGFGRGSIGKLKNGNTSAERLQKIADYFDVSIDYLLGQEASEIILTPKDERDIKKDLENIMEKLRSGVDGPANFDGEEIPEDDRELFAGQVELMLRRLKAINKEKYNPNKRKE